MTRKLKRSRKPKPKHLPPTPVPVPDDWSDQQALAVYDFCSALQELIWRRYATRSSIRSCKHNPKPAAPS